MKAITLNKKQISMLIEENYLEASNNEIIELKKDNLILNIKGYIYYADKIKIQFTEQRIENKEVIDYIKNLVCEHLNLKSDEVIYLSNIENEFEFKIRFAPNKEWQISVCEAHNAINNTIALRDEPIDIEIDKPFIGLYKRLGNSTYYFRWFEEI